MGTKFLLDQVYQKIPGLKKYEPYLIEFLEGYVKGKKSLVVDEEFLTEVKTYLKTKLNTSSQTKKPKNTTSTQQPPTKESPTPQSISPASKKTVKQPTGQEDTPLVQTNTQNKSKPNKPTKNTQSPSPQIIYRTRGKWKAFLIGFLVCLLLFAVAFYYQFIFAPNQGLPHLDMEKIVEQIRIPKAFAPTQ